MIKLTYPRKRTVLYLDCPGMGVRKCKHSLRSPWVTSADCGQAGTGRHFHDQDDLSSQTHGFTSGLSRFRRAETRICGSAARTVGLSAVTQRNRRECLRVNEEEWRKPSQD